MFYSSQLRNAAFFFVLVSSASGAMAMRPLQLAGAVGAHSIGAVLIASGAGNIADSMSESYRSQPRAASDADFMRSLHGRSHKVKIEVGIRPKNADRPVFLTGAVKCVAGVGAHLGATYLVSRAFRSEERPSRGMWWFGATCKTAAAGLHTLGGAFSAWCGAGKVLTDKQPVVPGHNEFAGVGSVLVPGFLSGVFHFAGAGVDLVGSYLMG